MTQSTDARLWQAVHLRLSAVFFFHFWRTSWYHASLRRPQVSEFDKPRVSSATVAEKGETHHRHNSMYMCVFVYVTGITRTDVRIMFWFAVFASVYARREGSAGNVTADNKFRFFELPAVVFTATKVWSLLLVFWIWSVVCQGTQSEERHVTKAAYIEAIWKIFGTTTVHSQETFSIQAAMAFDFHYSDRRGKFLAKGSNC